MSGAGKSQNQPVAAPTPKSDKIPLFVERQTYRRRRLVDGARALPVLGLVLWLVPLLWAVPESKTNASSGLIYIFVVWIGLPLVAGILIQIMKIRPRVPRGDEGET